MIHCNSLYLYLTIDNPEFAKIIPDIYSREHQLSKADTSNKETFLDLNIEVIGSNIHSSVYNLNAMTSGFLLLTLNWTKYDCHLQWHINCSV